MKPAAGPEWGTADAGLLLAGEFTMEVLGSPFALASTSEALADTLALLLAGFRPSSRSPSADRRLLVVDGCARHGEDLCAHRRGCRAFAASSSGPLLSWLLAEFNAAALNDFEGFASHAGVLSRGGRAIAIPAESGGGKTTLVAAGLLAGFDYVSDEALCVDFRSHNLVAYPRALVLSTSSRDLLAAGSMPAVELSSGEWALTHAQLRADVASSPLHLAHVVGLVRRPGPPHLARVERSETMAWLLRRSFNHYRRPAASFALVADLARGAGPWRLEFSDPLEGAALLLDRLGAQ